jgi:hypothetical protein
MMILEEPCSPSLIHTASPLRIVIGHDQMMQKLARVQSWQSITSEAIPCYSHSSDITWYKYNGNYYGLAMSLLAGSKTPISLVFIFQLSEACPQPFLYATIRPSYGRTPTPLPPEWKATPEATVHHLHPAHAVASAAVDRAMERQDQQNDWRKGDGLPAARLWPHLKHEKICLDLTRRSPLWPCKIAAELLRNVRASRGVMAGVKATAAAPVFTRIARYQ